MYHKNKNHPAETIVISGATGFVGRYLANFLSNKGFIVKRLVRKRPANRFSRDEIYWNPDSGHIETFALERIRAVIHLAGENISDHRWTKKRKQAIYDSRIKGTRLLSQSLARLKKPPEVLISASAVGYYGNRDDEILDEDSKPGTGFLANLCCDWEMATQAVEHVGVRVVHTRFGTVLSPDGGYLKRVLPLFRRGLGATFGSGEAYMSWIAIDDLARAIAFILATESVEGPVNLVAPNPVSAQEMADTLANMFNHTAKLRISPFFARLLFGEMAEDVLLSSCRAIPKVLLNKGFEFSYPVLLPALKALLQY